MSTYRPGNLMTATFVAAVALSTAMPAFAGDGLTVFDWSGYEDPAFRPAYAAKHAEPDYAFFGDEE